MKTVDIKGKKYIEVNERLKYFRTEPKFKDYSLISEIINLTEDGIITIKAIIRDANDRIVATGLAQEKESSSFINKTSFVENCETSAWGRALGNLGIGIDTSIASAEEVLNASLNQEKPKEKQNNDVLEHIRNIQSCSNRQELEQYWETLKATDKKNADIMKAFKEMGTKYPKN